MFVTFLTRCSGMEFMLCNDKPKKYASQDYI